LYVGDPSATVDRPLKELKGFAKIKLAPGEKQTVTLTLTSRSFAYWSEKKRAWTVDPGRFVIYAGDSSEDSPLSAPLTVQ
jgi:beta-glucosidase